ncbi:MAG TPA: NYN domain-containing protein [Thermoleophilaceae bacterium]
MEKERWIVDGMNVIGSRPDGWWRDRPGAMRDLAEQLGGWAAGRDVTVVFDGRPVEAPADGIRVEFASRGGRNAADDDIVRLVEADSDPKGLRVVTSDRELSRRVRELGAEVVSARAFRHELEPDS